MIISADALKELPYLQKEIIFLDRHIQEAENTSFLKGMDKHKKAVCVAALTDLVKLLKIRRRKCAAQLARLHGFLDSLDDPFVRELFQLRYVRSLEWRQIDKIMRKRGYYYGEGGLRKKCERAIMRYNKNDGK